MISNLSKSSPHESDFPPFQDQSNQENILDLADISGIPFDHSNLIDESNLDNWKLQNYKNQFS
jgi:hypothetical protein